MFDHWGSMSAEGSKGLCSTGCDGKDEYYSVTFWITANRIIIYTVGLRLSWRVHFRFGFIYSLMAEVEKLSLLYHHTTTISKKTWNLEQRDLQIS